MTTVTNPWRPPSFEKMPKEHVPHETDRGFQTIFTLHGALDQNAIKGLDGASGFRVIHGTATVTGSKTGIVTGLTTVTNVTAIIDTAGAAFNQSVTARPSTSKTGAIDIYIFQPTSTSDSTPIPATAALLVRWIATGD